MAIKINLCISENRSGTLDIFKICLKVYENFHNLSVYLRNYRMNSSQQEENLSWGWIKFRITEGVRQCFGLQKDTKKQYQYEVWNIMNHDKYSSTVANADIGSWLIFIYRLRRYDTLHHNETSTSICFVNRSKKYFQNPDQPQFALNALSMFSVKGNKSDNIICFYLATHVSPSAIFV